MKLLSILAILLGALYSQAEPQNFHVVKEGHIYRGARPTDQDLKYLADHGIRTILNLQGGDLSTFKSKLIAKYVEPGELPENIQHEKEVTIENGMSFINAPLTALFDVKTDQAKKLAELMNLIKDPKNLPMYVHCEHGKDRTGLVIALYRHFTEKVPAEWAYVEMLTIGHNQNAFLRATHGMDEYFFQATGWNPKPSFIFSNAW